MKLLSSLMLAVAACFGRTAGGVVEPLRIPDAIGRKVMVDVPAKRVAIDCETAGSGAVAGVEGWSR